MARDRAKEYRDEDSFAFADLEQSSQIERNPRNHPQLVFPVGRIGSEGLSTNEKALTRQGFFVINPEASRSERMMGLPPRWQPELFDARTHQGENRLYLLKDHQGLSHGVMTVSDRGPKHNKLVLTPRFMVEAIPVKRDHFRVNLIDAGKTKHTIADAQAQTSHLDVLTAARGILASEMPNIENPLAYWDAEVGHVKRHMVPNLRLAFGDYAGFRPIEDRPQKAHGIGPYIRPRFGVTTQRYQSRNEKGQMIMLVDDMALGTDERFHVLHRVPNHERLTYKRATTVTEAIVHEVLPHLGQLTAYRNLTAEEVGDHVRDIQDRIRSQIGPARIRNPKHRKDHGSRRDRAYAEQFFERDSPNRFDFS